MRAAADTGVIFMVPNFSSKSFDEILAERAPGQTVHFQMYVNPDRSMVVEQIRACERHGVKVRSCLGRKKMDCARQGMDGFVRALGSLSMCAAQALCITVDSACIGKRERDLRNKIAMELGQLKQQVQLHLLLTIQFKSLLLPLDTQKCSTLIRKAPSTAVHGTSCLWDLTVCLGL